MAEMDEGKLYVEESWVIPAGVRIPLLGQYGQSKIKGFRSPKRVRADN